MLRDEAPRSDVLCEHSTGYGTYCRKYRVFFCAGKGNCENPEEFGRAFEQHNERKRAAAAQPQPKGQRQKASHRRNRAGG